MRVCVCIGSTVISRLTGSLARRDSQMRVRSGVQVYIDCSEVAWLVESEGREVEIHWRQKVHKSTISGSIP